VSRSDRAYQRIDGASEESVKGNVGSPCGSEAEHRGEASIELFNIKFHGNARRVQSVSDCVSLAVKRTPTSLIDLRSTSKKISLIEVSTNR